MIYSPDCQHQLASSGTDLIQRSPIRCNAQSIWMTSLLQLRFGCHVMRAPLLYYGSLLSSPPPLRHPPVLHMLRPEPMMGWRINTVWHSLYILWCLCSEKKKKWERQVAKTICRRIRINQTWQGNSSALKSSLKSQTSQIVMLARCTTCEARFAEECWINKQNSPLLWEGRWCARPVWRNDAKKMEHVNWFKG